MEDATVVANEIINEEPFKQSFAIECLAKEFLVLKQNLKKLYISTNEMMAPLGAHGQILAKDDRVSAVMDALHSIDNGVYDAEKPFKCSRLSDETITDWCLAEAGKESLRECMKLLKEERLRVELLRQEIKEGLHDDREVADFVNELKKIAVEFAAKQQLRDRISKCVDGFLGT